MSRERTLSPHWYEGGEDWMTEVETSEEAAALLETLAPKLSVEALLDVYEKHWKIIEQPTFLATLAKIHGLDSVKNMKDFLTKYDKAKMTLRLYDYADADVIGIFFRAVKLHNFPLIMRGLNLLQPLILADPEAVQRSLQQEAYDIKLHRGTSWHRYPAEVTADLLSIELAVNVVESLRPDSSEYVLKHFDDILAILGTANSFPVEQTNYTSEVASLWSRLLSALAQHSLSSSIIGADTKYFQLLSLAINKKTPEKELVFLLRFGLWRFIRGHQAYSYRLLLKLDRQSVGCIEFREIFMHGDLWALEEYLKVFPQAEEELIATLPQMKHFIDLYYDEGDFMEENLKKFLESYGQYLTQEQWNQIVEDLEDWANNYDGYGQKLADEIKTQRLQ